MCEHLRGIRMFFSSSAMQQKVEHLHQSLISLHVAGLNSADCTLEKLEGVDQLIVNLLLEILLSAAELQNLLPQLIALLHGQKRQGHKQSRHTAIWRGVL